MPVSEARQRATRKYDAENMTTVGCRISRRKAEQFTAACGQLGTTKYAVLKQAIENTIENAKNSPGK